MSDNFGIKEALKVLGVKQHNAGVSTGANWLEAGSNNSFSFSC